MFCSTLKRSAATVGVVAGLLAAAGPASAQILDGPVLAKAGPQPEAGGYLATDPSSEVDNQMKCLVDYAPGVCYFHTVKAPANAVTASFSAQAGLMRRDADRSIRTVEIGIAPLHDKERGEVLGVEPL